MIKNVDNNVQNNLHIRVFYRLYVIKRDTVGMSDAESIICAVHK